MRTRILTMAAVLVAMLAMCGSSVRAADTEGDRFHFDIGLTFMSGAYKVDNAMKSEFNDFVNNPNNGVDTSGSSYKSLVVPVGLSLNPYYTFGFGLGIGAGIGPVHVVAVERFGNNSDNSLNSLNSDYSYGVIVPVGLDARYEFINSSGVVPYARLGFRVPVTAASNNLVSDPRAGIYAGVGVVFTKAHIDLEAAYDSSKVKVDFDDNGDTRVVEPDAFEFTVAFHF